MVSKKVGNFKSLYAATICKKSETCFILPQNFKNLILGLFTTKNVKTNILSKLSYPISNLHAVKLSWKNQKNLSICYKTLKNHFQPQFAQIPLHRPFLKKNHLSHFQPLCCWYFAQKISKQYLIKFSRFMSCNFML